MGYRIGLILGTKASDYPRMIRMGVQNALEEGGHTLVCLAGIVSREYRDFVSLEGFNTAVILLLRALEKIYPEQSMWLTEQASLMHLHVARRLDAIIKREVFVNHMREWRRVRGVLPRGRRGGVAGSRWLRRSRPGACECKQRQ